MCGITGWVDYQQNISSQHQILENMNGMLKERGPDAEGIWLAQHAALGHRRLIIIDPVGGTQPMIRHIENRKYVICYNGELYNMAELSSQLRALGYSISSRSDTELILYAYAAWGTDCPRYLNGIFAFAIWDESKEELFLARDRVGVKPLFYASMGSTFLFASEIKALLAHPLVQPEIDEVGLAEILLMGPARTPGIGVFKQIQECRPGNFIHLNKDRLRVTSYWELSSTDHTDDWNTTVEKVRDLVKAAVKRQMVSDVPLGTMLSGGLDSSAISAIAKEVFVAEKRGVLNTFSIDFQDNHRYFVKNEFQPNADAPWAALMAENINSRHHNILLNDENLINAIPHAVVARDLPGMTDIDASLMLFCREIKKVCTVILSGECADEIFGGYPWFYREDLVHADTFPWAKLSNVRLPFISEEISRRIKPLEYIEARYQEALAEVPRLREENALEARMREIFYLNLTRWMPTLLDRKDRMSMACGLEVRVPFCDHILLEYVFNIPWAIKFANNREKGLLRYALKDLLPEAIVKRKKSPFPKTHNPVYLQRMSQQVANMIQDKDAPIFQIMNRGQMQEFLQRDLGKENIPWFGQLMNVPALLAYWLQINHWLKTYNVIIK